MPYTIWSRGRLVGETDLGFIYRESYFRCGWFYPSEIGERLMPAATGVAPAMRIERTIGPDATAHADVLAAIDEEQALELELRGPSGHVIETENIAIIDTHYLLSIAACTEYDTDEHQLTSEEQSEIDEIVAEFEAREEGEPWRAVEATSELPRYQVQTWFLPAVNGELLP